MSDEYVEVTLLVSRKAYDRAAQLAKHERGLMSAEDFINCLVEIHLEEGPKHPFEVVRYTPPQT